MAFAPEVPPPITRSQPARDIVNLEATEQTSELASGVTYNLWAGHMSVIRPKIVSDAAGQFAGLLGGLEVDDVAISTCTRHRQPRGHRADQRIGQRRHLQFLDV